LTAEFYQLKNQNSKAALSDSYKRLLEQPATIRTLVHQPFHSIQVSDMSIGGVKYGFFRKDIWEIN
jgi:hypothetical protein